LREFARRTEGRRIGPRLDAGSLAGRAMGMGK